MKKVKKGLVLALVIGLTFAGMLSVEASNAGGLAGGAHTGAVTPATPASPSAAGGNAGGLAGGAHTGAVTPATPASPANV